MFSVAVKGLLYWAFILLSSTLSQAMEVESQIEVVFFNVGQGNCTVVKSPDKKDVWIIDAGSKKNPYNRTDNQAFTKQNIATAISKWVGFSEDMTFHVIISHPDEDHYNIIPILRNDYPKHKFIYYISDKYPSDKYGTSTFEGVEPENINYIAYQPSGLPEIQSDPKEPKQKKQRVVPENKLIGKHSIKRGANVEEYAIEFLNAGVEDKPGGPQNTNLHSLIVKVIYGKHSVLLTGDATARTFEEVEEHSLAEEMQNVTILQSSHHGALTEGSNTKHFIEYIKPGYVVFSAPAYSSYDHPNSHVVEKYAQFFQGQNDLPEGRFHFFFLNKNITPLEMDYNFSNHQNGIFTPVLTYRQNVDGEVKDLGIHVIALTNYPILHTGSHGTIIFRWKPNGEVNFDTYDYGKEEINSPDKEASPLKNTTDIIFLEHSHIDSMLIKISLDRQYACLGIKLHDNFDNLHKEIESSYFSELQAIYIEKTTAVHPINNHFLQEILNKLPKLHILRIYEKMLAEDYKPLFAERRFLGLPIS